MNPQRELEAISELADACSVGWPQYSATAAALAASTIPGTSEGRGSDVPDPVHHIAASHVPYQECSAQISEALGLLRDVQRRMASVRRQHPETAREVDAAVRAARCSGRVDPLCTGNAVRGGDCWRCLKREERARKREQEAS